MSDRDDELGRSEGLMNTRALFALSGHGYGPGSVSTELIELLLSEHQIHRNVRHALASALQRGMPGIKAEANNEFGQSMPWLEVGGMGRHAKLHDAIAVRRNWFDAAECLKQRREEAKASGGKRGYDLMGDVGEKFALGIDGIKKAATFRKKFLDEIAVPGNDLVAQTLSAFGVDAFDPDPNPDGPTGGDHYACARALFIEREAELACK